MKQSERPTYKIDREFNRLKKSMWEQKGRFCIYCGKPAQEFHHIVPRHAGGNGRPSQTQERRQQKNTQKEGGL